MLVALLTILAFNSYFRKKYFWSILFLCIGVLVKESMIMTAGFVGFVYLLEVIISGNFKGSFKTILGFGTPLVMLLIFLSIQKAQNGWYFFPYHTELISDGVLAGFKTKFKDHFKFIFYSQGRLFWFPFFFLSVITAAIFSKHKQELMILITFIGFSLLLFSMAFYMDRYLLYIYPLLSVVIIAGLFFQFKNSAFTYFLLIFLFGSSIYKSAEPSALFRYDASLTYQRIISYHKHIADDLCDKVAPGKIYANFPINMSLWEPYFGYADKACLNKVEFVQDIKAADYVILFSETLSEKERLSIDEFFVLSVSYDSGAFKSYLKSTPPGE